MKIAKTGIFLAAVSLLAACGGLSKKLALDPESDAFYRKARLIMTGPEQAIFSHLPDPETRKEFIVDFWEKRDPTPDTPVNEFKIDFDFRVDYANKYFLEGGPGMNTDRGRIFIYLGPPESRQEYFSGLPRDENQEEIHGSILHWGYPQYELGIEFIDERGNGVYRFNRFEGFFFQALDNLKLGQETAYGDVFKKKIVDFGLTYESAAKTFHISIPANALALKDEEGKLRTDLVFVIYIYPEKAAGKDRIEEARTFIVTDNEFLMMKQVPFTILHELAPGKYYVDVIVKGKEGSRGKIRKIFEVKAS